MIRIIVVDLDGTLLTSQSKVCIRSQKVLEKAAKQGIHVVIATGRGQFDVKRLLTHTDLSPWIIGSNGATIHKPDGSIYHTAPLEKDQVIHILKWLEENEYYFEAFSDQAIFTPSNGRKLIELELERLSKSSSASLVEKWRESAVEQFKQTGFHFIPSYKVVEQLNQPIYHIAAFSFDKEKLTNGFQNFSAYNRLNVTSSGYYNFEIEDNLVSKGNALIRLAEYLQIPLTDVVAIGDSLNDISMLKAAGISVAMKNAAVEVQKVCQYQTASNDREGVAKAIEELL